MLFGKQTLYFRTVSKLWALAVSSFHTAAAIQDVEVNTSKGNKPYQCSHYLLKSYFPHFHLHIQFKWLDGTWQYMTAYVKQMVSNFIWLQQSMQRQVNFDSRVQKFCFYSFLNNYTSCSKFRRNSKSQKIFSLSQ